MKKSMIASAIALGLGIHTNSHALSVNITQMNFGGLFAATGIITSNGASTFTSVDTFYAFHWTAETVAYFDTPGANTWADTGGGNTNDNVANGDFNYNFNLTSNQVAWGTFFDWNGNYDIPTLNIMTCSGFTPGDTCTGIGTPMQTPPFPGQDPSFNGVVVSSVPLPTAVWLLGSGLVGIAGLGIRRKKQTTT